MIAAGDIYRATARWVLADQICNTVWHLRCSTTVQDASVALVMQNAASALTTTLTGIAAAQHESVLYQNLTLSFIAGNGDPHGSQTNLTLEGEQTGEALPGLLALPFFLATGFSGRRFNGRFHWGGLTEALQDDGRLTAAGETLAAAIRGVLSNRMGNGNVGGNFTWVVFSRTELQRLEAENPGIPPTGDSQWSDYIGRRITDVSNGDILGSMYSRKIGRGS